MDQILPLTLTSLSFCFIYLSNSYYYLHTCNTWSYKKNEEIQKVKETSHQNQQRNKLVLLICTTYDVCTKTL